MEKYRLSTNKVKILIHLPQITTEHWMGKGGGGEEGDRIRRIHRVNNNVWQESDARKEIFHLRPLDIS